MWLTVSPLHQLLSDRPTDENRNTASDPTFLTWCRSFLTKLWLASAILKVNRLMSPGDDASRSMQLQRWWRHQCCSAAHGPTYQIKADELKIFWCIGSGDSGGFRGPLPTLNFYLYVPFYSVLYVNGGLKGGPTFGSEIRCDPKPLALRSKRKWNLRKILPLVGYWTKFFSRFWRLKKYYALSRG